MSKEEKNKMLPKLRFPKFKKSGSWKSKELETLLIKNSIKNKDLKYSLVQSISNKHGFINQDEYFEDRRVASQDTTNYYVIEKGHFAYNPSRINIGSLAYKFDSEVSVISPLYVSFKANNKFVEDVFLLNWFLTEEFKRHMKNSVEGGVRNTLSFENLIKIQITFPSLNEQQKIASCLSSLDELITAENQKLEVLKAHKKGLMQQLFPADGEIVPKLRFAEFMNSGEWHGNLLGTNNVAHFVNQKVSLQELRLERYVSTENLLSDYGGKIIASKLPANGSFTEFRKDDILLSNIRPYLKKVWFADIGGAASNDVIVIRAGAKINALFLSFLLKNDYFINYIMKSAEGVKMPRGDKDAIREYPVVFPSLNEQQKIADCLSSLDDLITAQAAKTEALKQHKKGLMQGLFPKADKLTSGK